MSIHPAAGRGFREAAEIYERARPDYPQGAVAWLARTMRLGPAATVIDLGAGTGKLTRHLRQTGARVIAVEPVPEMRVQLDKIVSGVEILAGTAEAIALPDHFADAVTVAGAFHWFRLDEALAEIHRVLRPGGSLGLIWNVRDVDQPLQAALDAIVSPHERHVSTREWRAALATTPLFEHQQRRRFRWYATWNAQRFVAFVSSLSEIAALPDREREGALERVRKLTARLPGRFNVAFRTDAYVCRRH
jgi:ubiquinone/menaquinone biosynthesis C-methylase UbiE